MKDDEPLPPQVLAALATVPDSVWARLSLTAIITCVDPTHDHLGSALACFTCFYDTIVRERKRVAVCDDCVRAAVEKEREACAKLAEEWGACSEEKSIPTREFWTRYGTDDLAAAIRARGQA